MQNFLKINDKDNVIVALQTLKKGTEIVVTDGAGHTDGKCLASLTVIANDDIPAGHKMAIADIPIGGDVVKYGCRIGLAAAPIRSGDWIHVHNLKTALGDLLEYTYEPVDEVKVQASSYAETESGIGSKVTSVDSRHSSQSVSTHDHATFLGFNRPDGKVGVRNEIWVIPTVGCVNNVAASIARQANAFLKGSVEEVIAFPHPYGCSQMGDDQENTRKILADLINHPNAGGVLVLGLGCENSGIETLKPYIGEYDERRVKFIVSQDHEDEIEASLEAIRQLIDYAAKFKREPVRAAKLIIGLKCGGSDGLSGITANPLVGRFSDMLVAHGGTTILTEVPEMFGAETLLMNRCATEELFLQTVDLINDFKNYFKSHNQTIYENPSPGNKEGGISTLEDKSLGCTQKSGSTLVRGVLAYGETVKTPGLNLLSAPGNDLVASTALAAAGAHIVLFTTGRGTPFACPVPTMKISTNSALASKKSNWIDFNAGVLVEDQPMKEVAEEFFRYVLAVASGEKLCSEKAGFHDLAIFKQGVTL
ncbi:MAG: altronate dehydratase [Lachnospiraceae bacterium]|nr:altronate dehydratase [Lachnospiraceae bacterium]